MFSLSITGTGGETTAGIPNFITITASSPSVIYYNFDEEEVSITNSYVYVEPIPISSEATSITIRTFAITADGDVSETFVKTYIEEDETVDLPKSRRDYYSKQVFVYDDTVNTPPSGGTDVVKGYTADGTPSVFQDEDDEEYDVIKQDSEVVIVVSTPSNIQEADQDDWQESNLSDLFFNPRARVVVIETDDPDNKVSDLLMRPYGSMADLTRYYNGALLSEFDNPVSGDLVRQMYSKDTGRMASYYFDNIAMKWVIVERDLSPTEFDINIGNPVRWNRQKGVGLVFKWISYPGRGNWR